MRAQLNQIIADLTAIRDTLPDDPGSNAKMSAQSIQLAIRKNASVAKAQRPDLEVVRKLAGRIKGGLIAGMSVDEIAAKNAVSAELVSEMLALALGCVLGEING